MYLGFWRCFSMSSLGGWVLCIPLSLPGGVLSVPGYPQGTDCQQRIQEQCHSGHARAKWRAADINPIDCWYELIAHINDLRAHGQVLLVTDIDNTLVLNSGVGQPVRIQSGLREVVAWLRAAGNVDLLGLTARSYSSATEKQLQTLEIPIFTDETPLLMGKEKTFMFNRDGFPLRFKSNIIYHGDDKKGDALRRFLEVSGLDYDTVVFIDDFMENCEAVVEEVKGRKADLIVLNFRQRQKRCRHSHSLPPTGLQSSELKPVVKPVVKPVESGAVGGEATVSPEQKPKVKPQEIAPEVELMIQLFKSMGGAPVI